MSNDRWQTFVLRERATLVPAGHSLRCGATWWARMAWRALVRFGMLEQEYEETYQVIRVPPPSKLFEAIWAQIDGIYDAHRKPTEIIVGPGTLAELLSQPEIAHMMQPQRMQAEGCYNGLPFPVPVRVVPQFEGVLVL